MSDTSVILSSDELLHFLTEAEIGLGSPDDATCLIFVRWSDGLRLGLGATDERTGLEAGYDVPTGQLYLRFVWAHGTREIPLPVDVDGPQVEDDGLVSFGLRKVARGLWALAPSLNIPAELHGYIVLHGVPEPAPWERLILTPHEAASALRRI